MSDIEAWRRARSVLAVRLDAMGDVAMTTPALRALRESAPGRRITLLTSPSGAAAAALAPDVDDVIVHEAPWMKASPPRESPDAELAMIRRLAELRFDAAVIFTVYSQNPLPAAWLCRLAGIPLRLAHSREPPYQLLTDWIPEPEPDRILRHEVRRQLDLVAHVGASTGDERLSLRPPDAAVARVDAMLREMGLGGDRRGWVVIHPGSTAPSRRYPPEGFAEVARRLAREHGLRVLVTGGEPERGEVAAVCDGLPDAAVPLAGALNLGELLALLARAPLLISNNTGPVHLAAAAGAPVIDLYALTNPQHTPWMTPHRVLNHDVPCKYCYKSVCPEGHHHCLRLVPPARVVEAALELLR
ncbi:glycosyltransferase family 9 protein [Paludisphaera sp.]|uniref:glycosyltransferase family 9 protein n=1 Tax=Paludisphaera sp. TaxID=2017432 RepID=UPI00301D100A